MAFPRFRVLTVAFMLGVGLSVALEPTLKAATEETEPAIKKIRGKVVTVTVPEGYTRITLQQLVSPRKGKAGRKGAPAVPEWRTVSTKYPEGASGQFTFRLSKLIGKRYLRVVGSRGEGVPDTLLTGATEFEAEPEGFKLDGTAPTSLGEVSFDGAYSAVGNVTLSSNSFSAATADPREVEESDIWKIANDRLYFYNETRGLQIFDIQNPDDPALLGTVRVLGNGEQMYLLENGHAVLLARGFSWWNHRYLITFAADTAVQSQSGQFAISTPASLSLSVSPIRLVPGFCSTPYFDFASAKNEVIVADTNGAKPKVVSRVPYLGTLRESRLVGNVLYLVTDTYEKVPGGTQQVHGSKVVSIDLKDPVKPIERASIFLPGWGNVVTATDRFLFVSRMGSTGNAIEVIDISSPVGAMAKHAPVSVAGTVSDKFKLHLEGNVLTVISQEWRNQANPPGIWRSVPVTVLANYSLENPDAPVKLGSVDLAPGETVRATRFDNGRAYVVTFVQQDPLWVVDLADAANPKVLGHVEVPGFSTYIEPLGDRLVTIGLVNSKPAVSLFDISNPTSPKVLSQIALEDSYWTHSEATSNEKAFNVLPEENLILLPFQSYGKMFAAGVQLFDLLPNQIVKRGVIRNAVAPRRAGVHKDRIIAISSRNLLSVDATNRDQPKVTADIEISWGVDRVLVAGNYLLQIGYSGYYNQNVITISPTQNSDESLATFDLGYGSVLGASIKDGILHVVQGPDYYTQVVDENGTPHVPQRRGTFKTFDVSKLPQISSLGSASLPTTAGDYAGELLWVNSTTLLWTENTVRYQYVPIWIGLHNTSIGTPSVGIPRWDITYVLARGKRLIAFDVTTPSTPKFASEIKIGFEEPWNTSDIFTANGSVFFSYKHLGIVLSDSAGFWAATQVQREDPDLYKLTPEKARLKNRYFLRTIDYGDPAAPSFRDAVVNIPGQLKGVSPSGQLLFTFGQYYKSKEAVKPVEAAAAIHVSALDGTKAHFVDQLPLASGWEPTMISGETIAVLHPESAYKLVLTTISNDQGQQSENQSNPNQSRLETWGLGTGGKLAMLDSITLDHETQLTLIGNVWVAYAGIDKLRLIDGRKPEELIDLGQHSTLGFGWPQYENADGDINKGVWLPLGSYGIDPVLLNQ